MGCFRTTGEIAEWPTMEPETRKTLMTELPERERFIVTRRKKRRHF